MKDYYLAGEEKFGAILSHLYAFAIRFPMFGGFYDFVVSDLLKSGARNMLDIGTGPGSIPIRLARSRSGISICGIDPSRAMIGIAKRNSEGMGNLSFLVGSSRHVPTRAKFDIIYSTLSFHHWKEQAKSLRYLSGFLRSGGEIRIYEYDSKRRGVHRTFAKSHSISREEVEDIAHNAGLRISGVARKKMFMRISISRRQAG